MDIDLGPYFTDDDGDALDLTATYTLAGSSEVLSVPGGIFTKPSSFVITVASTSITDTGIYTFSLMVTDTSGLNMTTSFTLTITNEIP